MRGIQPGVSHPVYVVRTQYRQMAVPSIVVNHSKARVPLSRKLGDNIVTVTNNVLYTFLKIFAVVKFLPCFPIIADTGRGDWGPLGHFSYFVKYLDFEKQDACVTYHNLLTIHSAT